MDRLPSKPNPDALDGVDGVKYKAAMVEALGAAGLIEYTSSKFASAALLAKALTDSQEVAGELQQQIEFVHNMHRRIDGCDDKSYANFNGWVLSNLSDDIDQLGRYVDKFYKDGGSGAKLERLEGFLEVVKIPFSLTTMIASRPARISWSTGVKNMETVVARTRGRLGWAIAPSTGAAWHEAAAIEMLENSSGMLLPPSRKKRSDLEGLKAQGDSDARRCSAKDLLFAVGLGGAFVVGLAMMGARSWLLGLDGAAFLPK
jgi:hypothetical protein